MQETDNELLGHIDPAKKLLPPHHKLFDCD